jgi:hypothetical protein
MSLFHASDRMSPGLDRQAAGIRLLPLLYGLTLFVSALLLFSIQPMFAKMVLPKLGGAPAVWSVAMVFFQGSLLIGYAYAHLLARTLSVGQGALVHLGVLAAAGDGLRLPGRDHRPRGEPQLRQPGRPLRRHRPAAQLVGT